MTQNGSASIGVAPQSASSLGKNANFQTLVSVTLASSEMLVMNGLRLLLLEACTSDAGRMDRANVPYQVGAYRTKPEINRERCNGMRFAGMLADSGYRLSRPPRHALTEHGLTWDVGIPCKQKVYPGDPFLTSPFADGGRLDKNPVLGAPSRPAEENFETAKWQAMTWRRGTKGKFSARFDANEHSSNIGCTFLTPRMGPKP